MRITRESPERVQTQLDGGKTDVLSSANSPPTAALQQRCHQTSASAQSPSWPPMPGPRLQRAAKVWQERIQPRIRNRIFPATESSSFLQAHKSVLTKANIDPQPPSAVFTRSSGGGWLCFRPKHSCRKRSLQDVGNTYARVTDSHLLWLCSRPVSTAAE